MQDVCDVRLCLLLDVPEDVLEQRLLRRALTSGRLDDATGVIKKRISAHQVDILPILERFAKPPHRLEMVCGNQQVGAVTEAVCHAVLPVLQADLLKCTHKKVQALQKKDWAEYSLHSLRGNRLMRSIRELSRAP